MYPYITNDLKQQIMTFKLKDNIPLLYSLEQFRNLIAKCPNYGFDESQLLSYY